MKNKEYIILAEDLHECLALLGIAKYDTLIMKNKRDIVYEKLLKIIKNEN